MQVLNFIIKNILTQASVVVGLIALLGLVLQKKPIGTVVSGTCLVMQKSTATVEWNNDRV